MLCEVDFSQPCLIRNQVEIIDPKFSRIWKKLISLGLLNLDENDHNLIAELRPTMITNKDRPTFEDHFFRQLNLSRQIREFNEAAFHPLYIQDLNNRIISLNSQLNDAHNQVKKIVKNLSFNTSNLIEATYNTAVLLEMLSIQKVSVRIFLQALHKISYLQTTAQPITKIDLPINHIYKTVVDKFHAEVDSLIAKLLVTDNDKKVFNKIQEVERLLLLHTSETGRIKQKANELLTLIPQSFDAESNVTEILFLRAHHLVSSSIVFRTILSSPFNDTVYEFLHLRQDILMYSTLKKEMSDILPCSGKAHKSICQMLEQFKDEFNIFHQTLTYKRIAVRYFNTRSSDYIDISKFMLEFDNLLRLVNSISSELVVKTNLEKAALLDDSKITVVRSWNRLTTAMELAVKLLDEYQSIWKNIEIYGMGERSVVLNVLKRRISIIWNNLKIKQSCQSGIFPNTTNKLKQTNKKCELPESLKIEATVDINSETLLYAKVIVYLYF